MVLNQLNTGNDDRLEPVKSIGFRIKLIRTGEFCFFNQLLLWGCRSGNGHSLTVLGLNIFFPIMVKDMYVAYLLSRDF